MFTGIVEEVGTAKSVSNDGLSISAKQTLEGMAIGDSISVNGACLTVTSMENGLFSVNVMPETLRRTDLGGLKSEDRVNLERPLTLNSRLGGHFMQGHIDDTGRVMSVTCDGDAYIMEIAASSGLMRYIVSKGFIGVDGVSLTVVNRIDSSFSVSLVSYTWEHTNLCVKKPGALVNLEVDILAKYLEQLVKGGDANAVQSIPSGSGAAGH